MKVGLLSDRLRDNRGFTLVELLAGVAIMGIIVAGVVTSIYQLLGYNTLYSHRLIALREIEKAVNAVSRDVWQAESVQVNGADYFIRVTYGGHEVVYTLNTVDSTLQRQLDSGASVVVAENIDPANTSVSLNGGTVSLRVVSMVTGWRPVTVTREVLITRRAG